MNVSPPSFGAHNRGKSGDPSFPDLEMVEAKGGLEG